MSVLWTLPTRHQDAHSTAAAAVVVVAVVVVVVVVFVIIIIIHRERQTDGDTETQPEKGTERFAERKRKHAVNNGCPQACRRLTSNPTPSAGTDVPARSVLRA